jgi:hypothetical protein
MAEQRGRRRTAPKRALIGPLVMLASGVAVGAMMWRFLMLEPPPGRARVSEAERLSRHDQRALERLLHEHASRR